MEIEPKAARLIIALRDIGYTFNTAVSDIIDNSIDFNAKNVWILTGDLGGTAPYIVIADDGKGMDKDHIIEALRYGSTTEYETGRLGKFGLGLKTSSLSQCRKLSIISKTQDSSSWVGFSWDLDHVIDVDKWEALEINLDSLPNFYWEKFLRQTQGTIIVWEKLDRLFQKRDKFGLLEDMPIKPFSVIKGLDEHLAMVFHRFLSGEVNQKDLKIKINGTDVIAWDPFFRAEPYTIALEKEQIFIEMRGITGHLTITPYVLPHESQFSSKENFRKASGPKKWNKQQGFYVYRQNRLIQSGGWNRIRKTDDEHSKLLRVSIDFQPELDEAFQINITKTQVTLPESAEERISEIIGIGKKRADERYRTAGKEKSKNERPIGKPATYLSPDITTTERRIVEVPEPGESTLDDPEYSKIVFLVNKLLKYADSQQKLVINDVLKKYADSIGK